MSFRSRLYITALGIALFVIAALAWASWDIFSTYKQGHADERNNATQYEASASKQGPETCRPIMDERGVFDWLACLAESVGVDGSVKQAEYDLKAQQDMAVWALGMLIVTIWLSVITLVGVLFVGWTLRETRRAVKAADDAVKVTREIGIAQISPYLSIVHASAFIDERNGICFTVQVKNSGQTPAKNVHVIVSVWVNRACTPPDSIEGEVMQTSVEVFSRPLDLGDIPAQSVEGHGLYATHGLSFPVDSVRTEDGCIQAGAGNIGVFAKDSFNNELFEFGGIMVATGTEQYNQWTQGGHFSQRNIFGSFGNETAMRGRGWKDYNYQSHQLPWEDKPVENLE